MVLSTIKFFLQKQAEVAEFLVGLTAILWAAWVLVPIWFGAEPLTNYDVVFGFAFLAVGLTATFLSNTSLFSFRRFASFVQIVLWIFVAAIFTFVAPRSPSVPVYFMLAVISLWVYVRLIFLEYIKSRN